MTLLTNLTIYGGQPLDSVRNSPANLAITLDRALYKKFEKAAQAARKKRRR